MRYDTLRINIKLYNSASAKVGLFRIDGNLAQKILNGNLIEGVNSINTPIDGVAPGLYILKSNFSGNASQQILKKVIVK